jgi:osmotically-inducible protein OsmY
MRITLTLLMTGLLASVGCSDQNVQNSSTSREADTDLKQSVQSRLASDQELAQIDVSADAIQNRVTLSGTVRSEQARLVAVDKAKTARSNVTVVDRIEVIPEVASRSGDAEEIARDARQRAKALGDKLSQSLDDTWIYAKIEAKLANQSAASTLKKIHVDVEKNQVTLRGEVDSISAKREAERIARETYGVKRVNNLLTVRA